MHGDVVFDFYRGFRFESHWINSPGFIETVKEVWEKPVNTQDVILCIHVTIEAEEFCRLENSLGHSQHHIGQFGKGTGRMVTNSRRIEFQMLSEDSH
jgi:hypothetical protein